MNNLLSSRRFATISGIVASAWKEITETDGGGIWDDVRLRTAIRRDFNAFDAATSAMIAKGELVPVWSGDTPDCFTSSLFPEYERTAPVEPLITSPFPFYRVPEALL